MLGALNEARNLIGWGKAIDEKIRELSNCHIVYSGIDFQKKEAGIPKKIIKVEDIPGLSKYLDHSAYVHHGL
ncbi:hypothetical protein GIB67_025586 [Kingdonia uniflora]|uniref:Uncharacterized protein n=1 Tax=Kingdonia uniflora TaxID=39325 RepID=A0A7J7M0J4_9MAGN|nr:hypothetical protein GIB67_025586 [Kingdonia uniflora]